MPYGHLRDADGNPLVFLARDEDGGDVPVTLYLRRTDGKVIALPYEPVDEAEPLVPEPTPHVGAGDPRRVPIDPDDFHQRDDEDYVSVTDSQDNETRVPQGLLARDAVVSACENFGYSAGEDAGLVLDGEVVPPDAVLVPGERYELVLTGAAV